MRACVASAPVKVIWTGEHAVVYGYPAVVSALSARIRVRVRRHHEDQLVISHELSLRGSLRRNTPEPFMPLRRIVEVLEVKEPFVAEIRSDVPPACGLGTSAAVAVAFAGALTRFLGIEADLEEIRKLSYEAEKITHGRPSGIDNTVATYGGLLLYRSYDDFARGDAPEVTVICVDTGVRRRTKDAVMRVKRLLETQPDKARRIFEEIAELSLRVWRILRWKEDIERLGMLLVRNHELLRELGVSCPEIERIVKTALSCGALGAKLTGAGLGGVVLVLPPQEPRAVRKLFSVLSQLGRAWVLSLSNMGLHVEKH